MERSVWTGSGSGIVPFNSPGGSTLQWGVTVLLLLLLLLKCRDYSAAITQLRGHFTKSTSETVEQLNADVCWPSEWTAPSQPYDWRKRWDLEHCQKWGAGLSHWWQTVPCRCCSHRKGTVAGPEGILWQVDGTALMSSMKLVPQPQ